MKFIWERESDLGFCSITACPEEYDAFPSVPVLSMDIVPRMVSNERLTVAFVLAFGYYASGVITVQSAVSAELADAVATLWKSADVSVSDVNYSPKAITYGQNMFKLNIDGTHTISKEWAGFGHPREFELNMSSISDSYSSSFAEETLLVPTNASVVIPTTASAEDRLLPYIAQAVLLAEDLDVGIIRLPPGVTRTPKLTATAGLLQTCGISLQFSNETSDRFPFSSQPAVR